MQSSSPSGGSSSRCAACQQQYRWDLEKNATQMPAISWRLTDATVSAQNGGEHFELVSAVQLNRPLDSGWSECHFFTSSHSCCGDLLRLLVPIDHTVLAQCPCMYVQQPLDQPPYVCVCISETLEGHRSKISW